jgi:TolB-like protein
MASFYSEMRRRRVFATVSIYVVAAWLIIQVADVVFPGWNIPEENIRYLVYAAIACFPIALAIGWKYDITTHGIKLTPPVSQIPDEISLPLTRTDRALLSFLLLTTIIILVGFGSNIKQNPVLEIDYVLPNSIAVLPFADLSEESDNQYFSTGLWREMINVMGQIDGFRVTPSTSAGYFKDRDLDLGEIKQKLQVANVIIGSVQKVASRVRITLSLNDTGEGTSLWSQTYDRDLEDIFTIQSDIAHAVAEVMRVQILGQEEEQLKTPPTSSVEAFDLLMLAQQTEDFRRGIELTNQAIELDPAYTDAYLHRGLRTIGNFYRPGGGGIEAALEMCETSLMKAREYTPDAPETSYLYNWLNGICLRRMLFMGRGNPDMERNMEAAFRRAVEINPSESVPHVSYSIYLRRENRIGDAEDQLRQALELDRLYKGAMLQLARVLSIQGKDDESFEWNQRAIEYFEDGYGELAIRYADLGHFDRAVATLLQAPALDGQVWGGGNLRQLLIYNLKALRDPEKAKQYEKPIERDTPSAEDELGTVLRTAWLLAKKGKYNEAFELAVAATDNAGATEWFILNEPAELALLAGRFDEAIRIFDLALPNLADPLRPDVQKSNEREALQLAYALQMEGETARASVLFGRILDLTEGRRRVGFENAGVIDACVYASLGETDKAIAAIRDAVDAGWRDLYGGMLNHPPIMLESLAGNPAYEVIIEEINADLALQLENVKSMDL